MIKNNHVCSKIKKRIIFENVKYNGSFIVKSYISKSTWIFFVYGLTYGFRIIELMKLNINLTIIFNKPYQDN